MAAQDGLPSVLDHAFADRDLIDNSLFEWESSPSDHAIVAYTCRNTFHVPHRNKKPFQPFNSEQLLCVMSEVCIVHDTDVQSIQESIVAVQWQSTDQLTCGERRAVACPTNCASCTDVSLFVLIQRRHGVYDDKLGLHVNTGSPIAGCKRN